MKRFLLQPYWPPLALGLLVTFVVLGLSMSQHSEPPRPEPPPPEPLPITQSEPPSAKEAPVHFASEQKPLEDEPSPFQTVAEPAAREVVEESFDDAATDRLPAGWHQWSSDGRPAFAVTGERSLSPTKALRTTSGSNVANRVWTGRPTTNVEVAVAVFLDSIIPAEVFARGANLNGTTPTYYSVLATRGVDLQLVRVVRGEATVLAKAKSGSYFSGKWAKITLHVKEKTLGVQVYRPDTKEYLTAEGEWQPQTAWAITAKDEQIAGPGYSGLNRRAQYQGTVTFDDFNVGPPAGDPTAAVAKTVAAADVPPVPRPEIPRHYPHIRTAFLAYAGNPMGAFEDKLLRESVDLVVSNPRYLEHIHRVAPKTPQLVYSNLSNLYLDLLTDWLEYADRNEVSREAMFYHAAAARPFAGDSPSSLPVTFFWTAYLGQGTLTNVTSASRGKAGRLEFGDAGESLYFGWPDRFREINVNLVTSAGRGWSAVLEYPTAVDASGKPTTWAVLSHTDTTAKFTRSGQLVFDPPTNWKPARISDSLRLHYVRIRTTGRGVAPMAASVLGRDYTGAGVGTRGTVPAFDTAADRNGDGYLDDAEYETRASGKDARFLHESRIPTLTYGQMRFSTNPSNPAMRDWAVDFHKRLLAKHPLAAGIFMDNSDGKPPLKPGEAVEEIGAYGADCGLVLNTIWRAIAPKWVLANTAGGGPRADPVVARNPAYFEEFAIRPFVHHWAFFDDLAGQTARRVALADPPPLAVIDTLPQKGESTDPRMMMAMLAYYYVIADPETSFLMYNGGFDPAGPWDRHWVAATGYDIGKPTDKTSLFATGTDPAATELTYRVHQRPYTKALVLYKPLSYARAAKQTATTGDESATTHDLPEPLRPLRADGTLGTAMTQIRLRNGEGAILVRP